MTNLKSKMSQKGSGNTSSRRSKNDNQKGFKKIAKELELDIDENLKILDTLLDEFTLDSLTSPKVQIIKADILTGEKAVANYYGDRNEKEKARVVFYLKTLKQFLTYQHGLKTTEKINKRILFLNQMLNPSEESFLFQREILMPEITLSEDLRALHDECLLIVGIKGEIYKTADDGSQETEIHDINLNFWSKNTIKDILNLEKDYREYQLQMLSDTAEYITFAQYLKNKLEEGKTLDGEEEKELQEIIGELQEETGSGNPEETGSGNPEETGSGITESGASKTPQASSSSNPEETDSGNTESGASKTPQASSSSNPEATGPTNPENGSSKTPEPSSPRVIQSPFDDYLRSKGLERGLINPDGDCLFVAFLRVLRQENPSADQVQHLRNEIVDWMTSERSKQSRTWSYQQASGTNEMTFWEKYGEAILALPRTETDPNYGITPMFANLDDYETTMKSMVTDPNKPQGRFGGQYEIIAFREMYSQQLRNLYNSDVIQIVKSPDNGNLILQTPPDMVDKSIEDVNMGLPILLFKGAHYDIAEPLPVPLVQSEVPEQKIGPAPAPVPVPKQALEQVVTPEKGVAAYISKIFRKGNNPTLVAAILARE